MCKENNNPVFYGLVINQLTISMIAHNQFKEYADFSAKYGHPKNMSRKTVLKVQSMLDYLREERFELYSNIYSQFYSFLLQDNLNKKSSVKSVNNRTKDFAFLIQQMIKDPQNLEQLFEEYQTKDHEAHW